MDWKQIISLSNEEMSDDQKEKIYFELIKDQKFDSKIAKKLFPISITILKYKGEQVESQREKISKLSSSDIDLNSTLQELEKLKKSNAKHEAERSQFKARIKELQEEIALTHSRELKGSDDDDSPDQLSEIDRTQELMGKLSMKNEHIKRLLRDIEKQEQKTSMHINLIKELKAEIDQRDEKNLEIFSNYEEASGTIILLEEKISQLSNQLTEMLVENQQLISSRQEQENEIKKFSCDFEERVQFYKAVMDEKQRELNEYKEKYENLVEQIPGIDVDSEQSEIKRLMESIRERDEVIGELEKRLQLVSTNLMDSTEIIDKIGREREENLQNASNKKSAQCCESIQKMLERSNKRCMELQDLIAATEADNLLKSKQAFEALETLKSYENSTDGLSDALKKIHKLQETVHQRDKQIHELVIELNAQNEILAENAVLRRRLGIPDEEIIETKGFLAKQKRFSKINDRLTLQLRASEEMRLQLKIEKNDLKRKINELEGKIEGENCENSSSPSTFSSENSKNECKECENCHAIYNVYESIKFCRNCIMKHDSNLCSNCIANAKAAMSENGELIKKIEKLESEFERIFGENEKLRNGLDEIFDKLRSYEDESGSTIINTPILEKLLNILNIKGDKNPMKNEENHENTENSQLKTLMDENEFLKENLLQMEELKSQYEELVRASELSDDDKHQLLLQSLEKCHKFESNLKIFERKIEFLLAENDQLHAELRAIKVASIDLKNHINFQDLKITEENTENREEFSLIQEELQQVRLELNGLCFNVLKNLKSLDSENFVKIDTEKLSKITIIEENLSTDFITRQEFNSMRENLAKMRETIKAHELREKNFEEIAKVAQYQLKSQQLMLSQFYDGEIAARHLIVDLQSQSNESYLLTKAVRDLKSSKDNEDRLKLENDKLKSEISSLTEKAEKLQKQVDDKLKNLTERENNNKLKIQYLRKSLIALSNQFSSMTPIYLISDFIKHYMALLEAKKAFNIEMMAIKPKSHEIFEVSDEHADLEMKIEIIKQKSSSEFLKQQLEKSEVIIKELHDEIAEIKMNEIKNAQHWNTIKMLFEFDRKVEEKTVKIDKEIQVEISKKDCATNTEKSIETPKNSPVRKISKIPDVEDPQSTSSEITVVSASAGDDDQKSLQMQLKKALILASSRSALLIETENRLSEAQGRIKVLEKNLENQQQQKQPKIHQEDPTPRKDDHILCTTISTLQNLILEKDMTLSRYQELLKSERQHSTRTVDDMSGEIKQLKKIIDGNENSMMEKERIVERMKREIGELKEECNKLKISPPTTHQKHPNPPHHVQFNEHDIELRNFEIKLKEAQNEVKSMEQKVKDLTNIERQLQSTIRDRDSTIKDLTLKLKASNDNFETLSENFTSTAEIDQLREMLEEKDKHIQDLTETLNQFHDDQQKFINDTALNSVEQVHIISGDLSRAEATNRILKTQLEAIKRQLTNVTQREKQAREMVKTYKNQLIRRPVFSVTSDKRPTSSSREEQLQKRIGELENELRETKDELRRQTNINDNKKAKNAAELGLWEKQKRYQEMAEKLKTKLTEKEIDFERMKASLQIAKNTITRLEREKMMLENKVKSGRFLQSVTNSNQQNSCQQCSQQKHHEIASESETSSELINVLKMRIESQQRRIIAMELEGKGSNVYVNEVEKLQEELSMVQARNIRLEAKNVQLQLDYDLVKQNDAGQRQEARIKHLEDYILILKDELAQSHAKVDSPEKHKHHEPSVAHIQALEQTILKLKRIVEKLQVENKYLKGTSTRHISTATYMSQNDRKKEEIFEKLKTEHEKLQKTHADSLSKISAMQIELELLQAQTAINVSCPHCSRKNFEDIPSQDIDVLHQQLQQKTALLEKAKILLQRAAGKEKVLNEKVNYLKKRVSELEGVPFISEENSDSG